MPIVVVLAGALAQAVEAGVAALEEATDHDGCSKRFWRTPLFWRLRAEIRKQVSRIMAAATCRSRKGGRGGRSSGPGRFGYDPFSYALNFDDGVATLFPTLFTIVTTTAKVAMLAPAVPEEEEKGAEVPPDDPSLPQTEDKGLIVIQ